MLKLVPILLLVILIAGCSSSTGQVVSKVDESINTSIPLEQPKVQCEEGRIAEFSCSINGNVIQKFQFSDCSTSWYLYEKCSLGCNNSKCIVEMKPKCQPTFLNQTFCKDDYVYDKFLTYNCEIVETLKSLSCRYGCENGKCIELQKPVLAVTESVCKGTAKCFTGTVTKIVDGDTIYVDYDTKIRLVLVDAPELSESAGIISTNFVGKFCPVGSTVIVDQDDLQLYDRYKRMLAVVWCGDKRLNEEIIVQGHATIYTTYCTESEFGIDEWAIKLGC